MAAIALFGLVAYRALPVSDLPNVDFPTLLVTAQLPGASPETMGASVATPLENQFSMIAGLESMTSVNSLGSTQITLEFDLNRSLDGAAVDVQGAITQAARLLPQGMPTPPTFTKVNPADQPILYLVITSTTVPPWTLDEYAETRIAQRISMVSGVAQVVVLGSQKYAVHAQLDPHALAARQIGINEVETALRAWNVNTPTGSTIGPPKTFTLQATGQLMNAAEYQDMIVSYRNGAPVRLRELGAIVDGVEDERTASWFYTGDSTQRAITLGIQRQPGTNTIAVADAVKALLPQFRLELPTSVHMDVLYDRSETIRESYRDVQFTMGLTLGLVIMVIFVFLRNVWATVIPSLALPFSIVGTFAAMYMLGYSLDNLSMMALILSVGFVGDADPDAVQPLPDEAVGPQRRPVRCADRARVSEAAWWVRSHAPDRAPPSTGHDGRVRRRADPDRGAVHRRAERLHSGSGHRPDCGDDRGRTGDVLRQAGRVPGRGRRDHPRRSQCRRSGVDNRRQRVEHTRRAQSRTDRRPSRAAG